MNKKLLAAFRKSGLTMYALAKKSGVGESTVRRWVHDELPRGLQLATAEKIAKALGCKMELKELA